MKKISGLLMLFISVTILIHCQQGTKKITPLSSEKKVTIYLACVKVETNGVDRYRLFMFDSNGSIAIDSLTTLFEKNAGQEGTIYWKGIYGIKKIKEIIPDSFPTQIFVDSVKEEKSSNTYKLELPTNIPLPGQDIKEKYIIIYIPSDQDTTITIDPFIRVSPPPI